MNLEPYIRAVPDFPKPGILFRDITPLLKDAKAFSAAVDAMIKPFEAAKPSVIAGIESRGFIFGTVMAQRLGCAFVPIRKPGKLPYSTNRIEYDLEYGSDALEIHTDAVSGDDRVVIADDLLATGGTLAAAVELVGQLGALVLGASLLIELPALEGREKVQTDIHCVLAYD